METVAQAIRTAENRLAETSDSPRLDAELLVAHGLGISRTEVLARMPDDMRSQELAELTALVERRLAREPIAYIVGYREFYAQRFTITPAVLTPRPETELLVEWALAWLVANPYATVVDVGTGSGAIAVSIALNAPSTVRMIATDLSAEALDIARANANALGALNIDFRLGSLFEPLDGAVNLVLANLPYLRADQIDANPDLAAEPRLALDGGEAGLELVSRLIDELPSRLAPMGAAALEIDPSQAGTVADHLRAALPEARIAIQQDLAGMDRFVTAVRLSSR